MTSEGREQGTVMVWKDAHGHGRIQADNGDVMITDFARLLTDGPGPLEPGQRVEFNRVPDLDPRARRWEARNVVAVDKSGKAAVKLNDEA